MIAQDLTFWPKADPEVEIEPPDCGETGFRLVFADRGLSIVLDRAQVEALVNEASFRLSQVKA